MKGFGPNFETTTSGNRAEFPLPQSCVGSYASTAAVFSAATPTGLLVNWGKRGQRKGTTIQLFNALMSQIYFLMFLF